MTHSSSSSLSFFLFSSRLFLVIFTRDPAILRWLARRALRSPPMAAEGTAVAAASAEAAGVVSTAAVEAEASAAVAPRVQRRRRSFGWRRSVWLRRVFGCAVIWRRLRVSRRSVVPGRRGRLRIWRRALVRRFGLSGRRVRRGLRRQGIGLRRGRGFSNGAARSSNARSAIADGQWHSFGGARGGAAAGAGAGGRSFANSGGARAAGGVRNASAAIADGQWHSFGRRQPRR